MGSTIWCDKCQEPFERTEDRRIVQIAVGREGAYSSELIFAQDYHLDCLNEVLASIGWDEPLTETRTLADETTT